MQPAPDSHGRSILSRRTLEIGVALAAILFGTFVINGAFEYPVGWTDRGPDPGYFPFWIGCLVIVGGVGALVETLRRSQDASASALTTEQARRALAFLLPLVGFLLVTSFLGLYVGMVLYLATVMAVQGGYRLVTAAAVSISIATFFFVVFEKVLKVALMKGPIEAWLGIY